MRVLIDKSLYSKTCDDISLSLPLFYTPVWLDTVMGQGYWLPYVLIDEVDVKALFPVYFKKKMGFKAIVMPPLTPYASIWLVDHNDLSLYNHYLSAFFAQLPWTVVTSISAYVFYDHQEAWLNSSFTLSEKNTYIFLHQPYTSIYNQYTSKMKSDLKRTNEKIEIIEQSQVDDLYELSKQTFKSQSLPMPIPLSLLAKIKQNLPTQAAIYSAKYQDSIVSSIMTISDNTSSYYILSGRSRNAPNGSISALIDFAIKRAMDQGLSFDFEGSSIESIAAFFRSFGAKHHTYLHGTRYGNTWIKKMMSK